MKYVIAYWFGFIVAGFWPEWEPNHPQPALDAGRLLLLHFWGTMAAGLLAMLVTEMRKRAQSDGD